MKTVTVSDLQHDVTHYLELAEEEDILILEPIGILEFELFRPKPDNYHWPYPIPHGVDRCFPVLSGWWHAVDPHQYVHGITTRPRLLVGQDRVEAVPLRGNDYRTRRQVFARRKEHKCWIEVILASRSDKFIVSI